MSLYILWVKCLMAHDNTFADAVWINIDETALPVYTGGKRGFRMRCKTKALENLMVERASLKLRRQYVTLIGAITSYPNLQKVLPQVFMPKSKRLKKAWKQASRRVPSPARVLLGTNGWSTKESLARYFTMLKAVVDRQTKKKVVIVMDCHPSHIAQQTIKWLRKAKWEILLVPSKLTYLLQPLDVAVFRRFKNRYFLDHMKQKTQSPQGTETFQEWFQTTCRSIRDVFPQVEGEMLFKRCGLSLDETSTRPRILELVDQDIARQCRPLEAKELTEVIGLKSPYLHSSLFSDKEMKPLFHQPPAKRLRLTLVSSAFTSTAVFGSEAKGAPP